MRIIFLPYYRTISLSSRPRYRGVSDQRLQIRGGRRWPVGGAGDAAPIPRRRSKPPLPARERPRGAARARPVNWSRGSPTRPRPIAVDRRPSNSRGEAGRLKLVSHRGRRGANLKTPRAGRLGLGGLAALSDFDKPRCREASRPAGPSILVCAYLRKPECAPDPWRPARPRHCRGGGLDDGLTRGRKEYGQRSAAFSAVVLGGRGTAPVSQDRIGHGVRVAPLRVAPHHEAIGFDGALAHFAPAQPGTQHSAANPVFTDCRLRRQ